MPEVTGELLRRGRDIADMDAALKAEKDGLIFRETSPRPEPIILYSMEDGEPIPMPPHIAETAMKKRYKDGRYLFTDVKEQAPAYKLGEVKCFLHPESHERQSGLLDAVGIQAAVCTSEHLASMYSKRVHAEIRHGKRWAALQEYVKEQKEQAAELRAQQQLEATLAVAGRAVQAADDPRKNKIEKLSSLVKEKADAGSPPMDSPRE